jgi:hypothetical protein
MDLSPDQRDRLARLIESELARLRDAALAAGASPEAIAKELEQRRQALRAKIAGDGAAETADGDAAGDAAAADDDAS